MLDKTAEEIQSQTGKKVRWVQKYFVVAVWPLLYTCTCRLFQPKLWLHFFRIASGHQVARTINFEVSCFILDTCYDYFVKSSLSCSTKTLLFRHSVTVTINQEAYLIRLLVVVSIEQYSSRSQFLTARIWLNRESYFRDTSISCYNLLQC